MTEVLRDRIRREKGLLMLLEQKEEKLTQELQVTNHILTERKAIKADLKAKLSEICKTIQEKESTILGLVSALQQQIGDKYEETTE